MEESENIFDQVREFFTHHPLYFGIFLVIIGIGLLLTAIYDGEWLFGNTRLYNLQKVDGWVNFFGRKTARIFVGIMAFVLMASGIVWAIIG